MISPSSARIGTSTGPADYEQSPSRRVEITPDLDQYIVPPVTFNRLVGLPTEDSVCSKVTLAFTCTTAGLPRTIVKVLDASPVQTSRTPPPSPSSVGGFGLAIKL